jgi:heat shock factor-binding protein 1
MQQNQ